MVHLQPRFFLFFSFFLQERTSTSCFFFFISCVTCVRIMKFASRPWQMQACVMGDNFPPRCVPGGTRTRTYTHTPQLRKAVALSAVPGSTTLCHTLPCCFCHMTLGSRWQFGEKVETTVLMHGGPLLILAPLNPAVTLPGTVHVH